MDEDMLNDDDLLDEAEEKDAVIPETQEVALQDKQRQRLVDREPRAAEEEKEETRKTSMEARLAIERSKQNQKDLLPPLSINKRRGTRSPDMKGTAASKKLAVRGRASPKGKLVRQGRPGSLRASGSALVPRTELYPSAEKPVSTRQFMEPGTQQTLTVMLACAIK
ncbi:hypothetical protein DY000_02053375 [Brassica cretica]|uniref:INO80 complex subunit B-like conserved region domain-containing protein n=1 Tax=Brassica cretica TaxID=69181 RepID=A0ABQ7A829_BRACR|nr:hypothetical protein DY000_02053375 [Brassica cretica]